MSARPQAARCSHARSQDLPNLIVTRHPLLRHKVTLLRKRDTPKKIFKELVDEIAMLLAYEVTSDLGTEDRACRDAARVHHGRHRARASG